MSYEISPELMAYMKAHIDDNAQPGVITALTVSPVIAYIAVALRFLARWKSRTRLSWDDYLIVVGLIIATGSVVTTGYMVKYGFGRHVILVTSRQLLIQNIIAAEVLYNCSIPPIKISLLCLYHRLFPSKWLFRTSLGVGGFIICYTIVQAVCIVAQCLPIRSFWTGEPATCIDFAVVLMLCSIFNVITDCIILALPIPFIWNLKVSKRKRFQLIATFGLGGVVTAVTLVRTVIVAQPSTPDKTWADVPATIISEVEICVGVLAACLPTYRPLFHARGSKTPAGSSYGYSAGSKGDRSKYGAGSMRNSVRQQNISGHDRSRDNWIQLDDMEGSNLKEEASSEKSLVARTQPTTMDERDHEPRAQSPRRILIRTDINVREQGRQSAGSPRDGPENFSRRIPQGHPQAYLLS